MCACAMLSDGISTNDGISYDILSIDGISYDILSHRMSSEILKKNTAQEELEGILGMYDYLRIQSYAFYGVSRPHATRHADPRLRRGGETCAQQGAEASRPR